MAGQVEDDRCTYKYDLYLPSLSLVFVSRFCSLHADNNPVLKEKRLYFIPIDRRMLHNVSNHSGIIKDALILITKPTAE